MCDDLFDENVSDEKTGERLWLKTSSNLQKEGYREGLGAGEELSLQDGFNEGFALSTRILYNISRLRGEISGILSLNLMRGRMLDRSSVSQLQELLGDLVLYETEIQNFNKTVFEKFKSHNEVSLGYQVKQTDYNIVSPKTHVHGDAGGSAGELTACGSFNSDAGVQLDLFEDETGKDSKKMHTHDTFKECENTNTVALNRSDDDIVERMDTRFRQFKARLKELVN